MKPIRSRAWRPHTAVGNDLIDLQQPFPCHLRFAQRILSLSEVRHWQSLEDEARLRYLQEQWGIREAVYKYLKQQNKTLIFRPKLWRLETYASKQKLVYASSDLPVIPWPVQLQQSSQCLHFFVATPGVQRGYISRQKLPFRLLDRILTILEQQQAPTVLSQVMRIRAKAWVRGSLKLPATDLQILRGEDKVPRVWYGGQVLTSIRLSFSHDGPFAACVWNGVTLSQALDQCREIGGGIGP